YISLLEKVMTQSPFLSLSKGLSSAVDFGISGDNRSYLKTCEDVSVTVNSSINILQVRLLSDWSSVLSCAMHSHLHRHELLLLTRLRMLLQDIRQVRRAVTCPSPSSFVISNHLNLINDCTLICCQSAVNF